MKKALVLFVVVSMVSILFITADARQELTFSSPGRYQITNANDARCNYDITCFTIAPGFSARNFRMDGINAGTDCTRGTGIETASFVIKDDTRSLWCADPNGRDVYSYSRTGNSISESLPLSSVVLGPGLYELHVGGGANAGVTVSFDLTSP